MRARRAETMMLSLFRVLGISKLTSSIVRTGQSSSQLFPRHCIGSGSDESLNASRTIRQRPNIPDLQIFSASSAVVLLT